jgi:hypothetical protein
MESAQLLDTASNQAIVQVPGRNFPGSVIQGDSLSHMYSLACELEDGVSAATDEELRGSATELRELLEGRLRHYDDVLRRSGISRPYTAPRWRT